MKTNQGMKMPGAEVQTLVDKLMTSASSVQSAPPLTQKAKRKNLTAEDIPSSEVLLRLPQVLARIPVSRATWAAGVASGKFPAPVRLGGVVTWRLSDILRIVEEGA